MVNKDEAKNIVSGKVTTVTVEGNNNNGFVYDVQWYTDKTIQQVECACKLYDNRKTDAIIKLAKEIDRQ